MSVIAPALARKALGVASVETGARAIFGADLLGYVERPGREPGERESQQRGNEDQCRDGLPFYWTSSLVSTAGRPTTPGRLQGALSNSARR